jgi:hypothetical protein
MGPLLYIHGNISTTNIIGGNGMSVAGRGKRGIIWVASLVATALCTLFVSSLYWHAWPGSAGSRDVRKQALVADMRINLLRSAEMEKSAVMALTDEDSRDFADQSKNATAAVDRDRQSFEKLLAQGSSKEERDLTSKFDASWKTIHQIDAELLESAVQNTNLKAIELSNTVGADLLQKFDDDLTKLTRQVVPVTRRSEMEKVAGQAKNEVLKIAVLQWRHIQAPGAAEKAPIETAMNDASRKADAAMKSLMVMSSKKNRTYIKDASSQYSEFIRLNQEIVRLSRLNTNRTTIEQSLGKTRLETAECDRALKALHLLEEVSAPGSAR